jgi:hypothetical protein
MAYKTECFWLYEVFPELLNATRVPTLITPVVTLLTPGIHKGSHGSLFTNQNGLYQLED